MKEWESVGKKIDEMQDLLRTFGESEGEMIKISDDAAVNVCTLDELEEHYNRLLLKMVANVLTNLCRS